MSTALLVAGCMTSSPVPSRMPGHPTATTEAEAWTSLQQRPLHLPTLVLGMPCPTTQGHQAIAGLSDVVLGDGPVYADFFGGIHSDQVHGVVEYADAQSFGEGTSDWGGVKVLWFVLPPYRGPVLIRGGRLDGSSPMRFNGGFDQQGPWDFSNQALLTELRFAGDLGSTPWPSEGTYTRLQAPGCYAYQVDGLTFSYPIIFKAIAEHSPPPKP
jgi:hypothetical protein